MTTLYLYENFHVTVDGVEKIGFSGDGYGAPVEIEINDVLADNTKSVAVGETWDAWGVEDNDPVSAFEFLWVRSDIDGVLVELTCDKGNNVGVCVFALELKAGIPLRLRGDGAMANYTADFATGTLDVIDRVRIKNPSTNSDAAKVRVFLAN